MTRATPQLDVSSPIAEEDDGDLVAGVTLPRFERFYSRIDDSAHAVAANLLARLEGAEAAYLTCSGLAAVTTAALSCAQAGDHIIGPRAACGALGRFFDSKARELGFEVTVIDHSERGALVSALRPNTRVVVVESPSNPMLQIVDIRAVAEHCHARNSVLIVDNTHATPLLQRPLELGADLVVHSASGYLGGHADFPSGAIVGSAARLERVCGRTLTQGGSLGPIEAWLLSRGMRTLDVRLRRQVATAGWLAQQLVLHPAVRRVTYPGLASHPHHELAKRQMQGFGGRIALELHGGSASADDFLAHLPIFLRSARLGAIESSVLRHSARQDGGRGSGSMSDGPEGYIQLSIGIEDRADLWRGLNHALNAAMENRRQRAAQRCAAVARRRTC